MNKEQKIKKLIQSEIFYEKLAIVLTCIYMIAGLVNISMLGWDISQDICDGFLPIVAGIVMIARIYFKDKTNKKALLFGFIGFVVLYLLIFLLPYEYNKFLLPLLLAGALYKSDYAKVLRAVVVVGLLGIIVIILLSRTGLSVNLVYNARDVVRMTFGTVYPTDFASYFFFLMMAFIAFNKRIPKYLLGAFCFLLAFVLYYFCRSTCSSMCLVIAGIGCIYYHIYSVLKDKKKFEVLLDWLHRIVIIIESALFGVLAVASIVLAALYSNQKMWAAILDSKLHSRIRLGNDALFEYGLSAFGNSDFIQYGNGGSTSTQLEYNFLDCSYMFVAIRFGLVFLILLCVQYVFIIRKAHKKNNFMLALALSVIAIHSFEEHHYIEPWYNVFAFAFLCDFSLPNDICSEKCLSGWFAGLRERFKLNVVQKTTYIVAIAMFVVMLVAECVFLPYQMSWVRAISTAEELESEIAIQIVGIAVIGILICWVVFSLKLLINYKVGSKRIFFVEAVGAITILIFSFLIRKGAIDNQKFYALNVAKDSEIIAAISETTSNSRIYVDSSSIYYGDYSKYITESFIYGQELALLDNVTYLCDADYERFVLTSDRFRMVEYGDGRMLYTNSDDVINALTDKGYIVNLEYPVITTMVDADNIVQLSGADAENREALSFGPYNICGAGYEVNLEIDYVDVSEDLTSTVLYIYEVYPQKEIEHQIHVSDILDGKYCRVYGCKASDNMYFRIEAGEGVECTIESLTLTRFVNKYLSYKYN